MKIRRGHRSAAAAAASASSTTTSGTSSTESEHALAGELNFIDSLSDLEGLQAPYAAEGKPVHWTGGPVGAGAGVAFALKNEHNELRQAYLLNDEDGQHQQQQVQPSVKLVVAPRRAKFSTEVRKARHRDRMQRVRMAEKKDIEVKRGEMETLETRLKNSIDGYLSQDQEEAEHDDYFENVENVVENGQLVKKQPPPATIRRKYVGLVLQQDQIKKENAHLVVRIHDFQKYEKLVAGELERANEDAILTDATTPTEKDAAVLLTNGPSDDEEAKSKGYWLSFTENEPPLFFEPLTWMACQGLTEVSYNTMLGLQRGVPHATMPGEGFGWNVSHGTLSVREDGKVQMQHRFVKIINPLEMATVEPITIDTISDNTWKIFNTSELYAKIYRTDMISKVLQQVDDYTSVLLRTYPDEQRVMRTRFLSLLSRVEDHVVDEITGEEQRRMSLLLSVLDPDECLKTGSDSVTSASSDNNVHWFKDAFAYLSFKAMNNGQQIQLEYGGYMDVSSEATQPAVVRNILEAMMRWERAATKTEAQLVSLG